MSLGFENLRVYNKTLEFIDDIYEIVKFFPKEERWSLIQQLLRASISIALNIAEGSGRTPKEFCHFITIAKTSAYECTACLTIALRRQYIDDQQFQKNYKEIECLIKQLNSPRNAIITQNKSNQ